MMSLADAGVKGSGGLIAKCQVVCTCLKHITESLQEELFHALNQSKESITIISPSISMNTVETLINIIKRKNIK